MISCKEKYNPVLRPEQKNYLVVEGILTAGGPTSIQLSRTTDLNENSGIKSESNANVMVVGSDGSQSPLYENSAGIYTGDLQLLNANTYSLHIRTTDGKDYASAMESVKQTPPIDTVSWEVTNKGVQLNLTTKDFTQQNKYYKWNYVETWEIHSAFPATYEYIAPQVVPRSPDEIKAMFTCWTTYASTRILIGSSAKLNEAIINKTPLLLIANGDERLSIRYSILVTQFAIDKNAYNFYQQLKSSTESLGSIFDPLPSDISGNVLCTTNPSEKVIGYISASSPQEKRIFIANNELSSWRYKANCEVIEVANNPDSFAINYPPYSPFESVGFGPVITAYKSASIDCLDCRLRGSSSRPSFW